MFYPNDIENKCYSESHIQTVLNEIKSTFNSYFDFFIESDAGYTPTFEQMENLIEQFGQNSIKPSSPKNIKARLKKIHNEAIEQFEKDREAYLDILDEETFEEYEDSPLLFKNALKSKCPIIRTTLMSKAKELGKYKREFSICNPNDLLIVCENLSNFAYNYVIEFENDEYNSYKSLEDLQLEDLDTHDYTVFGVIGGGIKSLFLQKLQPSFFAHRSKEAIWALWYLTNKKTFDCSQDSEFLMIDVEKSKTNQNYFYPYELFGFYAYNIYLLLEEKFNQYEVHLDANYRYVIVNVFLNSIAIKHANEIQFLSSNSEEKTYSWI